MEEVRNEENRLRCKRNPNRRTANVYITYMFPQLI